MRWEGRVVRMVDEKCIHIFAMQPEPGWLSLYCDGLLDGRSGVQFPAGVRHSSLLHIIQTDCAHPHQLRIQWVKGVFRRGVKWPGGEADHFPLVARLRKVELCLHGVLLG